MLNAKCVYLCNADGAMALHCNVFLENLDSFSTRWSNQNSPTHIHLYKSQILPRAHMHIARVYHQHIDHLKPFSSFSSPAAGGHEYVTGQRHFTVRWSNQDWPTDKHTKFLFINLFSISNASLGQGHVSGRRGYFTTGRCQQSNKECLPAEQ